MATKAVRYDGPAKSVYVPDPEKRGEHVEVERGSQHTFPKQLADELLERSDWSTPGAKPKPDPAPVSSVAPTAETPAEGKKESK